MQKTRGHALRNYVIRRLLLMVPTFIGITVVTFVLCQFVPGGPIDQLKLQIAGGQGGEVITAPSGESAQLNIPEEQLRVLEEYYGFDKPIPLRYLSWLWNLVRLDLGTSFRYTIPVIEIIKTRLPVSLFYGIITTLFTYVVCIPLGMVKAIRHRKPTDNLTSILIFVGYAIPGYALGAVLLVLFAVKKDWFPLGGFTSEGFADLGSWAKIKDIFHHAALPLVCYIIGTFAVMTMLMKNSLMENMSQDYIRTAFAKGLREKRVVWLHAIRNSVIPIAANFGHIIGLIIAGSYLIEKVFNIDGFGKMGFQAILDRDYPITLGFLVIVVVLRLVGNILSDITLATVDPRIRFK